MTLVDAGAPLVKQTPKRAPKGSRVSAAASWDLQSPYEAPVHVVKLGLDEGCPPLLPHGAITVGPPPRGVKAAGSKASSTRGQKDSSVAGSAANAAATSRRPSLQGADTRPGSGSTVTYATTDQSQLTNVAGESSPRRRPRPRLPRAKNAKDNLAAMLSPGAVFVAPQPPPRGQRIIQGSPEPMVLGPGPHYVRQVSYKPNTCLRGMTWESPRPDYYYPPPTPHSDHVVTFDDGLLYHDPLELQMSNRFAESSTALPSPRSPRKEQIRQHSPRSHEGRPKLQGPRPEYIIQKPRPPPPAIQPNTSALQSKDPTPVQSLAEDKGLGQLKGQEYRSMVAQLMRGFVPPPPAPHKMKSVGPAFTPQNASPTHRYVGLGSLGNATGPYGPAIAARSDARHALMFEDFESPVPLESEAKRSAAAMDADLMKMVEGDEDQKASFDHDAAAPPTITIEQNSMSVDQNATSTHAMYTPEVQIRFAANSALQADREHDCNPSDGFGPIVIDLVDQHAASDAQWMVRAIPSDPQMAPELTVAAVGGQAVFDSIPVAPGKGPLVLSFSASSGADPSASFPAPTLAGGPIAVQV
uniref:Uncharacterized protein n=1 Tax=Eutreptiella gymnastica TaxID=73025 RepID=A0A7S4D3Y7_9EUGL